jgi:hypothetical protein
MAASLFTNGWQAISAFIQTCWIIALVSSLLLVILVIVNYFDLDTDSELNARRHYAIPQTVLSFASASSWVILLTLYYRYELNTSIALGLLAGIIAVFITRYLSRILPGHASASLPGKAESLLGQRGKVLNSIPAHRNGFGKVSVQLAGTTYEMEAMTPGQALDTGAAIRVIDVVAERTLIVEKAQ